MYKDSAFAEVVESSLTEWVCQSWEWDTFPAFGSLVIIESKKRLLFGVVHQIQTGSMDPSRYPFAYQKTEEELLNEQPQIFEFLKTTFCAIVLGFQEKESITYQLAPEPPKIHSFVSPCPQSLAHAFFKSNRYLHPLFGLSSKLFNIDELLLALLKEQKKHESLSSETVTNFMETFSLLTGNDYRRQKLFLQRVQDLM